LAVDSDHETASPARDGSQEIPFGLVVAMAVPGAISTTIVTTLLPTHLVDSLNFSLAFGGFSTAMFGWGGAVGPYIWAAIAHRKGDLPCSVVAFLLSAPIVVLYLLFINSPSAAWLLFGVGFFATSAYILAITLARRCTGANLSRRMAWIVGGTWGIAYVVFMPLTWLAKCVGTGVIIRLTPIGYLVSAGLALWLMVRYPNSGLRARSSVSEAAAHDHPPV
jgi:MFS family permease